MIFLPQLLGTPCPPGVDLVNCFVDPCLLATCPAHPTAVCVANFCGGCNAEFFDALGNDVTNSCDNGNEFFYLTAVVQWNIYLFFYCIYVIIEYWRHH